MLDKTLTLILAGGQGDGLYPLTAERTKAAVPFGGKYRIIDFPLVNCLHSGLRKILVLTQYKSHSLQKHLRDGWSLFNPELGEYVTVVPPQMRTGDNWYSGSADAVYQNLYMLKRSGAEYVFVLNGEHIYRMDYAAMLKAHKEKNADVTVASMEIPLNRAHSFGVMSLDEQRWVTGFEEKPKRLAQGESDKAVVSMGIYAFSMDFLIRALEKDHEDDYSMHDFGHDLLPSSIEGSRVYSYAFGGEEGRVSPDRYWKDLSDLDSYYEANMELLNPVPPLDLYQPDWPIRTYQAQYPPTRTVPGSTGNEGIFLNSIAAGGVVISGAGVQHSVLCANVKVQEYAMVHESILLDDVVVGAGAELNRCIVDKGVVIPPGEKIGYDEIKDAQRFTRSDKGIVVVPKGYVFE